MFLDVLYLVLNMYKAVTHNHLSPCYISTRVE